MFALLGLKGKLIGAAIVSLAIIALLFRLHHSIYQSGKADGIKQGQEIAILECKKDQQITTKVSNVYQGDLDYIDQQLNAGMLRWESTSCVPIASDTGGRGAGQSPGADIPQSHRVDPRQLIRLAADADKERAQRRACQSFVKEAWKAKGQ